ncbi:MAG: DUF420 domain-containing protein [bacterium]
MSISLLIILSVLVILTLPGGLVAIERRDVKSHQFRMLVGTTTLVFLVFLFLVFSWTSLLEYQGFYRGAYWLLWWLTVGLGSSGVVLTWLAIWAMLERTWDLHRRAGMFGFMSGTVSGLTALLSTIMILFL